MGWEDIEVGSIVTGAIGLGIGLAVAGKIIKDITHIKPTEDGLLSEKKPSWRL
jgi:hypothetical protein